MCWTGNGTWERLLPGLVAIHWRSSHYAKEFIIRLLGCAIGKQFSRHCSACISAKKKKSNFPLQHPTLVWVPCKDNETSYSNSSPVKIHHWVKPCSSAVPHHQGQAKIPKILQIWHISSTSSLPNIPSSSWKPRYLWDMMKALIHAKFK